MIAKRIGSMTLFFGFLGLGILCWWSVESERERAQTLHAKNQKLALQVRAGELLDELDGRIRAIRAGEVPSAAEFFSIRVDQAGQLLEPKDRERLTTEDFLASLPREESKTVRRILDSIVAGKDDSALQSIESALQSLGKIARPFVLYHQANLYQKLKKSVDAKSLREKLIGDENLVRLPQAVVADLLMQLAKEADQTSVERLKQVARTCIIPILHEPRDSAYFWLLDIEAAMPKPSGEGHQNLLTDSNNKLMCHRLRSEFLREDPNDALQAGKKSFVVSSFDTPFAWWQEKSDGASTYRVIQPRFPEALIALLGASDDHIEVQTKSDTIADLSVPLSGIARDIHLGVSEPSAATIFPWRSLAMGAFLFVGVLVLVFGFQKEQRSLAEARQALESKSSFLANVSHQLKTPVTNLRMFAETLASDQVDDAEEKKRMLQIISTESARLGSYLHRILANARLENHESVIEKINVDELIESRLNHWVETASLSDVRLRLSIDESMPPIDGDAPSLADGLDNVVENAIAFTPANGTVEVRGRVFEGKLEITVTDQGPGIPETDRARIFDRFFRGEHARARRGIGTGLGLHIAMVGATRAGGTLKIAASTDQGTTMVFSFPFSKEPHVA